MFAKLARLHLFGRGRRDASILSAAPCNDNRPVRRVALAAPPVPRRVLACRWHQTPAGKLECTWHSEPLEPGSLRDSPKRAVRVPLSHVFADAMAGSLRRSRRRA